MNLEEIKLKEKTMKKGDICEWVILKGSMVFRQCKDFDPAPGGCYCYCKSCKKVIDKPDIEDCRKV